MTSDAVERPRTGRAGLLLALLTEAVAAVTVEGQAPRLLDCGGGTGAFAVPLASTGAEVTVLDISADALATLRRRAAEAGVVDRVHDVQGDVEVAADLVPADSVDLVLAHGILDEVDDPAATMRALAAIVRPGGAVAVLVANPAAAVLARALAGDPAGALRELAALDDPARLTPAAAARLCEQVGLVVQATHGVGVFADLVPGAGIDTPAARDLLTRLDLAVADRPPFADLAPRVLIRAVRPAG